MNREDKGWKFMELSLCRWRLKQISFQNTLRTGFYNVLKESHLFNSMPLTLTVYDLNVMLTHEASIV